MVTRSRCLPVPQEVLGKGPTVGNNGERDKAKVESYLRNWLCGVRLDFLKVLFFAWLVIVARSLRDLMHLSSLHSLLRTYERSTCSKFSVWRGQLVSVYVAHITIM